MLKIGIKYLYFYKKLDKEIKVVYGHIGAESGIKIMLKRYFIIFFIKDVLIDATFHKENSPNGYKHKELLYFYNKVKNWCLI